MIPRTLAVAVAAALAATACALSPQANNAFERARATYHVVQADPEVRLRAPVELELAQRTLAEAERFLKSGEDPAIVSHLAYLAEQRTRIAQKTAEFRKAEAAVATSSEERNRVLLEARAREAEAQRREAEQAKARAEAQSVREQAAKEKRAVDEQAAQLAAEVRRLEGEMSELKARESERGWVLSLRNDVLFDSARASLKAGALKTIDHLAQFMRNQPEREISIEGFTDSTGSDEANRRLSEQRAHAVKEALVARGIEAQRIDARGYGPAFPVASNETAAGRQLNRRVEVVVSPQPRLSSSGGDTRR